MSFRFPLSLALLAGAASLAAAAELPATAEVAPSEAASRSPFDPARHMSLAEVKPGMTGYGLSVFHGTTIEKFDVEVLSILRNFNPKADVVLIRCKGDYLAHTGSIAGMSGSPIFLKDDQGRFRMIGAFAYGWPLTKDPVAGVQPIEYMLKLPAATPADLSATSPTTRPGHAARDPNPGDKPRGLSWSLAEAGMVPFWKPVPVDSAHAKPSELSASTRLGDGSAPQLQPLATPLMAGGLSPRLSKQLGPLFNACGMTMLEAGGGGASADPSADAARLEPGSALAVPLLRGDVELTAIGTVTEAIGGRVWGFGHPFNNEGPVDLPMGSGVIHGVIANLQTSFKLGALAKEQGTLTTDESVGVAGRIGDAAPTVPIEFHVSYADGTAPRTYRFQAARHPRFTPMLAGVALSAAITGPSELPQYNTLDYHLDLEFANGQRIEIANTAVNANAQELLSEVGLPLMAASENPFEKVPVTKITGQVHIAPEAREAQILNVTVPRSRYQPGDTVKAFVTYKPFRGPEGILPVELELPRDLPQGTYQLIVSDAQRYFQDEQQSHPFRFTAESVNDVFGVLKDVASIRENAVYLRLLRQADGVAVGRVALPQLPSSRRQILLGAGRSNITSFVSSTVRTVPTEQVMSGSAEFAITIDPTAKVEVAGPRGPQAAPAPAPGAPPAGNPDESHKAPARADAPAPAPPPPGAGEPNTKDKEKG